jgi:hypothetical protein
LGEPLTRNSYFLFTSALVKTFHFSAVPGQPLPTLEPVVGFTSAYDGFKAVAKPRSGIQFFWLTSNMRIIGPFNCNNGDCLEYVPLMKHILETWKLFYKTKINV